MMCRMMCVSRIIGVIFLRISMAIATRLRGDNTFSEASFFGIRSAVRFFFRASRLFWWVASSDVRSFRTSWLEGRFLLFIVS